MNIADQFMASLHAGHWAWSLALALLGGLLTALSPCVYPLVPITLSVMGARQYQSHIHGFLVALSYVVGMALVYTTLAFIFASLGILLGAVMQSTIMLIMLAVIFFIFALFMFGLIPFVVPESFLRKLSNIGGKGFKGAFLMGMVAGLIAAPCTGPVLGFILTLIAEKQDIAGGIGLMLAFSLGLGLPFLLLGTFSSAIAHVPKSGPWMRTIKMLLGFFMLFTAGYYAYKALPRAQVLSDNQELSWHIIDHNAKKSELDQKLLEAKALSKPVLIDFFADWCIACHELDQITFRDKKIVELLNNFVLIRVDASKDSLEMTKIHQEFSIRGLPTLMIFSPDFKPKKIIGFIKPQDLYKKLLHSMKK